MNVEVIVDNLPKLLEGLGLTVELVALSVLAGFMLAVPTALARVSPNWALRGPAYAYIFFFRGTPLLVQIFLVYYGLSQFETVRDSALWPILREPYWCALIAFSLNTGAYTAEIFRGAIEAVPAGQVEAARVIGMGRALAYRRIILPQAFRIALPAYGNEIILMIKGSALASTITLLDLTGMARTIIARTYMPVEIFLAAGVLYLLLTFAFTQAYRLLEHRLTRHMAVQR
ncbi:MAG: ABC transporter permease [Rhodospirillales bacterium]|nr:ABC transporter permease [Rhodospirillales bacterium]